MGLIHKIGLISDTHGLVRPEAFNALRGVEHIIHAGDIGSPVVIEELRKLAKVTAVRGNIDTGDWALEFPNTAVVELGDLMLYVIHKIQSLDLDPRAAGFSAVICGHSHLPMHEMRDGVLYINPGSAGPRRFNLPVAVGHLTINGREVSAKITTLRF
jgi:putative phosphoesterase